MKKDLLQAVKAMWRLPANFESPALESAFLRDFCKQFASHRRVAIIVGFLTTVAYLGWDFMYSMDNDEFAASLNAVLWNRIGTAMVLLPFAVLSMRQRFEVDEHYASAVLVVGVSVNFLFYCRGFLLAPFPYDYMFFFMGMFINVVFGFSMLRLRAMPALVFMVFALLAASMTFAWNWQVKQGALSFQVGRLYLWVGLSFLVTVSMIGFVVVNLLERAARAAYLRADELSTSNQVTLAHSEALAKLNQALLDSGARAEQKSQALISIQQKMRQEAERRNREKSQFLASAVHDLRQPIQAISNALQPAERALQHADVGTARSMVEIAVAATQLMRSQLSAMLEISQLESGFLKADIFYFDIKPLMQDVCRQLGELAARDGVTLRMEGLDGWQQRVSSDRHFLHRILMNLVTNGIKYHDPAKRGEAHVVLHARASQDSLCLEVRDNGIGIALEHITRQSIFRPFFQANNLRRESEKGVGLGLSIVHAMVALLPGHELQVTSELGVGTCVALVIPWGDGVGADPLLPTVFEREASLPDLHGMYVLFVEDDYLVRRSTCALFDVCGVLYSAVESLSQLLESLPTMERVPDLVLTDYRLPDGATGADIVAATLQVFGVLPVVVVTGEAIRPSETGRPELLSAAWLRKPISPTELLEAMQAALRGKKPV